MVICGVIPVDCSRYNSLNFCIFSLLYVATFLGLQAMQQRVPLGLLPSYLPSTPFSSRLPPRSVAYPQFTLLLGIIAFSLPLYLKPLRWFDVVNLTLFSSRCTSQRFPIVSRLQLSSTMFLHHTASLYIKNLFNIPFFSFMSSLPVIYWNIGGVIVIYCSTDGECVKYCSIDGV